MNLRMFLSLRLVTLLGLLAVQLLACRSDNVSLGDAIQYGKTTCAECGAVITDARFAAQAIRPDETVESFDDPGCLFRAFTAEDLAGLRVFFHDHESHRWLTAKESWFARAEGIDSPQGYDWAAFGSFGAAQEAVTSAAGEGEILPYEKMAQRLAAAHPLTPRRQGP